MMTAYPQTKSSPSWKNASTKQRVKSVNAN